MPFLLLGSQWEELSQVIQEFTESGSCCCYGYLQCTSRFTFFGGTLSRLEMCLLRVFLNVTATSSALGLPCEPLLRWSACLGMG